MPRHGSAISPIAEDDDAPRISQRTGAMAGWPIRRKLLALVAVPMAVMLGVGAYVGIETALNYQSSRQASALSGLAVQLAQVDRTLRAERAAALAVTYKDPGADITFDTTRQATDKALAAFRASLQRVPSGGWPQRVNQAATETDQRLDTLGVMRDRVTNKTQPSNILGTYSERYTEPVESLLALVTTALAAASSDPATVDGAATLAALSKGVDSAALQRDELILALREGRLADQNYVELLQLGVIQDEQFTVARQTATADQLTALDNDLSSDTQLKQWVTDARPLAGRETAADAGTGGDPGRFNQMATDRISSLDDLVQNVALGAADAARGNERAEWLRAGLILALVIVTYLVVAATLAAIARTVTLPLRRLRAGAVEVASVQLPAAVRRIEQDGVAGDTSLPPVLPADAPAGPETLEVARAVDDLGAEALRLATSQVRLRRALDEAFVSMSRRSQSMVEKQLAIIDELESQEQDPDQLRNLFRLDHLAARMRRYNDNLLVLAGSAVRTRATAPVKIAELFRAATSEMEQYERVRLQPVSGASVAGTVAGELVHLLAELLDNAAMYSPPTSPIVLSAAFTADGGLQIEVQDSGVGISPGELERLNGRLSQPESIDTQVPSRMGLFVVARLARRGGFGVLLQARPDASGTVALVRVPPNLVIGAPGSTGEQPLLQGHVSLRSATPAGGLPLAGVRSGALPPAVPAAPMERPPDRPMPEIPGQIPGQVAPAAAAAASAAAAAAAAAGVRSVADEDGNGALPRRRRPPRTSSPPGLPPAAIAAATTMTPPGGLFTPSSPVEPGEASGTPDDEADAERDVQVSGTPPPPVTSPSGIPATPATPTGAPRRSAGIGDPLVDPLEGTPAGTSAPSHSGQWGPGEATPAAGLPRRTPGAQIGSQGGTPGAQEPLSAPTREFKSTAANPSVPERGSGAAPDAWDGDLPTELAARAAAASAYRPVNPDAPMIGSYTTPNASDPTPIFDSVSVWFTASPAAAPTMTGGEDGPVIDLRERRPDSASRWAALGDQRWLATNAQAASAPSVAGTTETGLPRRRPGANLLPSASAAAPPTGTGSPPAAPPRVPAVETPPSGGAGERGQDADSVRGRLGSYQRGLATARRARGQEGAPAPAPAFDPVGASLFTANREPGDEGQYSAEQGGDQ